jgi:hypothetical protein
MSGCTTGTPVEAEPVAVSVPSFTFHYYAPPSAPRSPDEVQAELDGVTGLMRAFAEAARASSDWRVVDAAVRAAAAEPSGVRREIREAAAAAFMLELYLLPGEAAASRQDAIAYHVNRLVEHRSPQLALIEEAVGRLDGYWSAERRERVRAQATEAAQAYMSARAGNAYEQRLAQMGVTQQAQDRLFVEGTAAALERVTP